MKANIFVPKVINVGYQNRSGTYTGKLAYVIYYDEKGKLRKEASWQSWRDKNIPNDEFENIPTSGFVLNKKAGDYSTGWDHRQAYCRVYDPRNFEFEITIENLLYILENTNSIKGKGLEGEFIYGWDGKDLVLMPVESPDYKQITDYNKIIHNNEYIKTKDLKVGATYITKTGEDYIYMGRFDKYDDCYWVENKCFTSWYKYIRWLEDNNIKRDNCERKPGKVGKRHCFYHKGIYSYSDREYDEFIWMTSTNNRLIGIKDDKCCLNYSDLFELLEGNSHYSPIDRTKDKVINISFDEFKNKIGKCNHWNCIFISDNNGKLENIEVRKKDDKYIIYGFSEHHYYSGDREILDKFPLDESGKHMIPVTLEEIYKVMKPSYIQVYLKNDREHERIWKLR